MMDIVQRIRRRLAAKIVDHADLIAAIFQPQ